MAKPLRKKLRRLKLRKANFQKIRQGSRSKRGNSAYKEPGSMSNRKQI